MFYPQHDSERGAAAQSTTSRISLRSTDGTDVVAMATRQACSHAKNWPIIIDNLFGTGYLGCSEQFAARGLDNAASTEGPV